MFLIPIPPVWLADGLLTAWSRSGLGRVSLIHLNSSQLRRMPVQAFDGSSRLLSPPLMNVSADRCGASKYEPINEPINELFKGLVGSGT